MAYTILTKKFSGSTFRLSLTTDGSAYLLCRPIFATKVHEVTAKAIAECGFDSSLASRLIVERLLEASVSGWSGLNDINGDQIEYSPEMLREVCEADPEFAMAQVERIRRIAREARLEEEKN